MSKDIDEDIKESGSETATENENLSEETVRDAGAGDTGAEESAGGGTREPGSGEDTGEAAGDETCVNGEAAPGNAGGNTFSDDAGGETVPDGTGDAGDDGAGTGKESEDGNSGDEKSDDEGTPESPETSESSESSEEEALDRKYIRLMADFQNYKRRTEKDRADIYAYASEKIVTNLLQILDNFERALAQDCSDEAYKQGMEMIFKQFTDVLRKEGLSEIEAVGQPFDPNLHHAVLTDKNDDFGSGEVTMVLQKGYKLNEKVIRPAMVRVNE